MFIIQQATLADANNAPLAQGTAAVQIQPGAVSQFDLVILSRLLQPFKGFFVMDVMGSYNAQQGGFDVLVDSILASDIQPA